MSATVSKLFNANCFVDGNSLLGRASEITLPDVKAKLEEHAGLGLIAAIDLPTGQIEKMVAKVKWAGFYADAFTLGGDPFTARKLQCRGSVETHTADGMIAQVPAVMLLTARWTAIPGGVLGSGKATEHESELTVTYYKLTLDGKDLIELDVFNSIWKVNGKDIRETYRKNLGG